MICHTRSGVGYYISDREDKYYWCNERPNPFPPGGTIFFYYGPDGDGKFCAWEDIGHGAVGEKAACVLRFIRACQMLKAGYPGEGRFGLSGVGRVEYVPQQDLYFYEVEKSYAHTER